MNDESTILCEKFHFQESGNWKAIVLGTEFIQIKIYCMLNVGELKPIFQANVFTLMKYVIM